MAAASALLILACAEHDMAALAEVEHAPVAQSVAENAGQVDAVEQIQALKQTAQSQREYEVGLRRILGDEPSADSEVGTLKQALLTPETSATEFTANLARAHSHWIKPSTSPVSISVDQLSSGTDSMIAVLRWQNKRAWESGLNPEYRSQAGFDVVAFNDDYPGHGLGSRVTFVPDGRSYYYVLVMPYWSGESTNTGRLTITGCGACDTQLTVPVAGQSVRYMSGNTFEIDQVTGSGDPWLFAMRLFTSTEDPTRLEGAGVSNDDGLVSSTTTKPLIYSNFSLGGQRTDLLFLTSYTPASSTSTARLLIGVQPQVIGLPQRSPNPNCVAPAQVNDIPDDLAATGCFNMATRKPVAGVIPYDVAHPFWSDGVIKERYLALADNTSIWVDSAGKWQLPVGGMMIKNFYYNQVLFETRFVAQLASGPVAYTYKWDGANATRADDTPTTVSLTGDPYLGARTWEFPSTAECKTCHTEGKNDFFLGLNTKQFNMEVEYESTGLRADQIRTLQALGVLAGPGLNHPDPGYEPRPDVPAGSYDSWEQARAFADVNCGYCHREGHQTQWLATLDVGFGQMKACNQKANLSDHDRLEPGNSALSFISERAHARGTNLPNIPIPAQMPPLATDYVDHAGVGLLDRWINGMLSCEPPVASIQLLDSYICLKADVRGVDPETGVPAVAKNVDAVACSAEDAAQAFALVDEGGGYVTLRPTLQDPNAPSQGDCLLLMNGSVVRTACTQTKQWYRDFVPGGGFQLRYRGQYEDQCLTKFPYGARLEPCEAKPSQLWRQE